MRNPAWSSFLPLLTLLAQVHGNCTTPPNQPHATLRSGELKDSYPIGTILLYNCIPGYKFIERSNPSIKCLDNSEWSTTPTFCEGRQCKAPDVENGRIESTGDLRLGEEITYVCDPGYRAIGSTTARCTLFADNKVLWDTDPPVCEKIPCERPPTILNGSHSGDTSLDHYTVGDVVTYSCGRDLSLIGNSSIVCITAEDGVTGIWDRPAPECKAVQCSRPQIQNGRLTSPFQPIYKHEHVLQFVCDSGYTLVGHEFVKCGADNKWQPKLPACVKKPGKPTIRPDTTEETITKEPGSTQSPGETVPEGNKTVGIVVGVLLGVLVLAAAIFALIKGKPCLKKGKSNSHPNSTDSYHPVPGKDIVLEEKSRP